MSDIYLIKRRWDGLWWRSVANRYTDDIAEAGHYTRKQAERYQCDGLQTSIHPLGDLTDELEVSVLRLEENLTQTRKMLAGVRLAELVKKRGRPEHYLEVARQCADLTDNWAEEGDVLELAAEAAGTIRAMHRLLAPSPDEGE